jgi:tetratricopeptide (TPR) repeat protein
VLAGVGLQAKAEQQYRDALQIQEKLTKDLPEVPEYSCELARTHNSLGVLNSGLGRGDRAQFHYREALQLQKKLADEHPDLPDYRQELANTHNSLSYELRRTGKAVEAEKVLREGIDIQQKLITEYPSAPKYKRDLANALGNLGMIFFDLRQLSEAEEQSRKSLEICEKLAVENPAVPEYRSGVANELLNLGSVLHARGELARAQETTHRALSIREKLAAEYPNVPGYKVDLGGCYCNLGHAISRAGKPDDSLVWFKKAIDILSPLYEQDHRLVVAMQFLRNSYWDRAQAYDRLRRYADAIEDWGRAAELSPERERPSFRAAATNARFNAGRVAEAMEEFAQLTKSTNWTAMQWYSFANMYALASTKLADRKKEYEDRAMELLQRALKSGFADIERMKTEPALAPIRSREEFKRLIEQLEGKSRRVEG